MKTNFKKDITIIMFVAIMLMQFPVFGKAFIEYVTNPEVVVLENPNRVRLDPNHIEVQAKEEEPNEDNTIVTTKGGLELNTSPTPTPTVDEYMQEIFGEEAESARKVAFCESSLNPKAKSNKSSASGLFQIIKGTFKQFKCEGDVFNPYDNIDCAKKIYDHYDSWNTGGGWRASYQCHKQV